MNVTADMHAFSYQAHQDAAGMMTECHVVENRILVRNRQTYFAGDSCQHIQYFNDKKQEAEERKWYFLYLV